MTTTNITTKFYVNYFIVKVSHCFFLSSIHYLIKNGLILIKGARLTYKAVSIGIRYILWIRAIMRRIGNANGLLAIPYNLIKRLNGVIK